ncbi:unnamed protein product, partial [Prorocentrum cordatum]
FLEKSGVWGEQSPAARRGRKRYKFTKRTMTFKRHLHHKAGETVAALGETSSAQSEQLCLALREPGIDPAIIGSAETGRPLRPPLSNRNPDRETAAERPPRPLPPVGGPEARRAPLPVAGRRPPSPPRGSARAAAGARGAASGAGSSPCRATAPSAADLREAAPSARACRAGSCSVDSAQGGGLRSPQSGRWWPLWAQKGLAEEEEEEEGGGGGGVAESLRGSAPSPDRRYVQWSSGGELLLPPRCEGPRHHHTAPLRGWSHGMHAFLEERRITNKKTGPEVHVDVSDLRWATLPGARSAGSTAMGSQRTFRQPRESPSVFVEATSCPSTSSEETKRYRCPYSQDLSQ